ncbi:hypothetical protein Pfo_020814 [Paulownia fortunei]|nr:hypothetical protein Pfo_020814 [Paulownia fortunei]
MAYAAVISLKQTIERLQSSSHIMTAPLKIIVLAYEEVISLRQFLDVLYWMSSSGERVVNRYLNALDGEIREAVWKLEDALESHVSNQVLSQTEESLGDEDCSSMLFVDLEDDDDAVSSRIADDDDDDDAVSSRIDDDVDVSKMVGLSDKLSTLKNEFTDLWPSKPTFGPKYQLKKVLKSILAQVDPYIHNLTKGDENVAEYLYKSLKGRRYLIVLDDVWYGTVWYDLKKLLPEEERSRVLLTTRLEEVAQFSSIHQMRFMNKEESWYLLREKVFGKESCPPQLEKAGQKIAENCEGLPLLIVTVAELLCKAEKTPEYWNKVAKKQILLPSYEYLPEHLKAYFLYMGVFPQNYEIPLSKLIKLWSAEAILAPRFYETVEELATECLEKLVSRSLVMVHQRRTNSTTKTCSLHSVFWHLCNRVSRENKFFHVLNSYDDGIAEGIKSQRRLCIHNSILCGIKDVYNSMESISTARSLLCFGPPHQYPVPICFSLRLLRVLDALPIRFYVFPMEVLKLVQLRYLALTYNGNLPPSISKLWNLQFLIVSRHLSIKSSGAQSYLPLEIWDMQELKHLQFMGSDLPDPCGALLPNLLTLLDVNAHSCTKGVLERVPNLKKLGIQIELAPDAAEPLSCFDHVVAPPAPLSIFPSGLQKLSLSGFGYPWKYMRMISALPNLEVLKLRCYAFRGPEWETYEGEFPQLKFLLLEDTDLVHWRADDGCFPSLQILIIRHCYKLKEIPLQIGSIPTLNMIELFDGNPSVVASAKQMQEDQLETLYGCADVNVHSSWDDGNLKP